MECWSLSKRQSWLYWLLMMIEVFMVRQTQGGCIEKERKALLEIKASFVNSYGSDVEHLLPTWVDNGHTVGGGGNECCDWERVMCNPITGHVTMLSLDNLKGRKDDMNLLTYIDHKNTLWPLNVSLFLHFEDLRSLNLSHDFLDNGILKTELERFSSLKMLEILDISWNFHIDNHILPSLTTLTSLRLLAMSYTGLKGNFPINVFVAMKNLEMLDLTYCSFYGTFQMKGYERVSILPRLERLYLGSNYFNESLITSLSVFPSLKFLDLSANNLSRTFAAQDCKGFSRLKRLEIIYLLGNRFNKSIISCLSALPSIKFLGLGYSLSLGSSFPIQELSGFSNLKTLDLRGCDLDSLAFNVSVSPNIMPNLEVLLLSSNNFRGTPAMEALASNFPRLKVLDLSNNSLAGSIPSLASFPYLEGLDMSHNNLVDSISSGIRQLSSLRVLVLIENNLNGSLLELGLCELKNLQELYLRRNMFEGNLPQCLSRLSSLKSFDISSNQFTGIILPSLIANLTSLRYFDLSDNKFEGSFSLASFANHTKLEVLAFRNHNDKFEVETQEPLDWIPMFQLKVLVLSMCNLNRLSSSVPSFLLHQHKLEIIDLSHNSLNGTFPNWLIENNAGLEIFVLNNNLFGGTIHISPYRNVNTRVLDMSANHLTGIIPHDIGNFLPYIFNLNLSRNSLEGALPPSLGNLSHIQALDLSNNNFYGQVPKRLLTDCPSLTVLKLSNNKLDGEILSRKFSTSRLQTLLLANNRFTGVLTDEITTGLLLSTLDISGNLFSGVIPGWITNLTSLNALVISNNMFEGQFPCGTAPFLFLDISENSFSGSVPSCLNLQGIKHFHLNSNRFTGSISQAFRGLPNILTLDMGNNKLSGKIPSFLGELSSLRILLLRKNNFRGSIPKQLCKLRKVSLIDLSSNSLSGSIPNCLQNIAGHNHLDFIKATYSMSNPNSTYKNGVVLGRYFHLQLGSYVYETQDEVQFIMKSRPCTYKGGILDYMSGLDLSCNNLTGDIPKELGRLIHIHALNLSHNQLTGPIPSLFSNLENIESLDISSNRLSGIVPSELTRLHYLSVFIVADNNLSGKLPEMKAQFGTFTAKSYEGNPFLCGPPLEKKCTPAKLNSTLLTPQLSSKEKWYDVDMVFFDASLVSTWFVFLMGFVGILYVNPNWRRRWFAFVEHCMYTFYYFLCDSLRRRKF